MKGLLVAAPLPVQLSDLEELSGDGEIPGLHRDPFSHVPGEPCQGLHDAGNRRTFPPPRLVARLERRNLRPLLFRQRAVGAQAFPFPATGAYLSTAPENAYS